MHAKLPAIMIVRKNHSTTTSAIALTVTPVKSANSSLIVGRIVTVKIAASTADQTISRTRAHGTLGRGDVASSSMSCIGTSPPRPIVISAIDQVKKPLVGYRSGIEAGKFKRRMFGGVAEWLKAAVC